MQCSVIALDLLHHLLVRGLVRLSLLPQYSAYPSHPSLPPYIFHLAHLSSPLPLFSGVLSKSTLLTLNGNALWLQKNCTCSTPTRGLTPITLAKTILMINMHTVSVLL